MLSVGAMGADITATGDSSLPLLSDKLMDNRIMSKMTTAPEMIHPIKLLAWGWLDDMMTLLDAEI